MKTETKILDYTGLGLYDEKIKDYISKHGSTIAVVSKNNDGLAPKITDENGYLRGDGTWNVPTASEVGALPDTTEIPIVSDTYSSTSTDAMSGKAVASAISNKMDKVTLATVATSGSYNDLANKPTIPTVNNATLTIQKNGTNVQTFTANQATNATANITVPTKTSDLINDSGFKTTDNNTTYSLSKSGSTITLTGSDGSTTSVTDSNTTYSSKAAASGGTDVSLVTTGEKATWNAKTSNIGTITEVKMNGASKGTSGVVDLGTVITAHQDISGKSDVGHKHTKSEITDFPTSMTPTSHDQASNTINAMTGYSKPSSTSAIATTDSLNTAIGKLEKALDGKGTSNLTIGTTATTAAAGNHTHDSRYYTENEIDTKLSNKLDTSLKGVNSGLAELDVNGKVPSSQLPSYVDDVIEGYYYNSNFYKETAHTSLLAGEAGKIYIDLATNKTYRWSGSTYVVISETLALGETSTTAYRGDRGKTAYDHSQAIHARTDATKTESSTTNGNIKINGTETTVYTHPGSGTNPHGTTKSDVGLSNVENKSSATIRGELTKANIESALGGLHVVTSGDGLIKQFNNIDNYIEVIWNNSSSYIPTAQEVSDGLSINEKLYINDLASINNVSLPSNPKFTDTVTTVSTSGSGNAITSISATNGAITATKGSTFLTTADISGKANLSGDTFTGNVNFSKGLKSAGIVHLGTDSSYHAAVRTSSPDNIIFSLYNGDVYTEDWFAAINNRDIDRLYLSTPRSKFHFDKPLNASSKISIDDAAYIQRIGSQSMELSSGEDWSKICYDVQDGHWTIRPYNSLALNLGSASYKFDNIYGVTAYVSASDKNDKNTINPLTDIQSKDFIMALNPVSYKFNAGSSGRTHFGMISQDVEEEMTKLGMSSLDFAGFIKSPKTNQDGTVIEGEYVYGLRYEEFIAPLIKTVQLQQQEIDELKQAVYK